MRRFGRVARRPDHWDSPHDRARLRLAERMAGDLRPDEAVWLDEHVADCPMCAGVAAQYAADRLALRALREAAPQPPRDLWARTAAAIEQESGGGRSMTPRTQRRESRLPLGALSGLAVVAVVIGASTLSGGFLTGPQAAAPEETGRRSTTNGEDPGAPPGAAATPFAVGAGPVAWVDKDATGALGFNNAAVDEVCPADGTSNCPALEQAEQQRLALVSEPHTIIGSPSDGQAVMIADDGSGGDQLLLVDLPGPSHAPTTLMTPAPTPTMSAPASSSVPASSSGPASAAPGSGSPSASATIASGEPTESPGTDTAAGPTPTPTPTPDPAPPTVSPSPSASMAASLAIASDIELIGESAAFSGDGTWFAFTARPDDASRGPDIYVWRVGDATARAVTFDGATVFGSWDGDQIVASRPAATAPSGGPVSAVTIRIDPATGAESPAGDVWRPVVDPTRSRAIGWAGSIVRSADGGTWTPESGTLALHRWDAQGARHDDQGQGEPGDALVLAETATAGFDVRWDERGEWVGVWVADEADPTVGRLSLYRVPTGRAELERPEGAPTDVPALPGFSIGDGRLAWATPPGQDGEGSRIQIVAWSDDGVGTVESAPGEDIVVIR